MSQSENNLVESSAELARASVAVSERYEVINGVPVAVNSRGDVEVVHGLLDAIDANSRRNPNVRSGTSNHSELDSFVDHINRMKEERSTVWANVDRCDFIAIYDYDPPGSDPLQAGWGKHQAKYFCPLSPEWKAWIGNQNQWMSQGAFSDWIDLRMDDLTEGKGHPKPIEMLEMSRNLQIYTKGTHTKSIDKTTGQYALVCKEEHTKESTKIPRGFLTILRVFDGGDQYGVEVRLQFKMVEGKAMFQYTIHRNSELKRDAFGEMRKIIAEKTGLPVFAGTA